MTLQVNLINNSNLNINFIIIIILLLMLLIITITIIIIAIIIILSHYLDPPLCSLHVAASKEKGICE